MRIQIEALRKILLFIVASSLSIALQAAVVSDNFNRPDSPDPGPNWSPQAGSWEIISGRARGTDSSLMTFIGGSFNEPLLRVDAFSAQQAEGPSYVAMVSLFGDLNNNIFIKIQDNDQDGLFDRVYFYYGNNGDPWSGMTGGDYFQDLPTPIAAVHVSTAVLFDSITLQLDTDFDGIADQTYNRGGIPLGSPLGTGIGVGGYGFATVDNFMAVPEPSPLLLAAAGCLLLPIYRRTFRDKNRC